MPILSCGLFCVAAAAATATALGLRFVRRARLAGAAGASAAEARAYDSIGALLSASRRSSRDVLAVLDGELRERCGADAMLVFVPEGDELVCSYAGGARAQHFERWSVRRDDGCLPALAAASGCRAVAPDGGFVLPADRYALAVPMIDAYRAIAVAYASWSGLGGPPEFDKAVAAIERSAMPYALARERETDRADAAYDGLTGLLGPRAFRRLLHEEVERGARPRRRSLCLWFVDTDGFKDVNDVLGHRAGDGVLRAIADVLRAHAGGPLDVPARNGGDEFCVLLRGSGKGRAIVRAQAFCDAIRAHEFGLATRITVSVGVAAYPHDAASASELLEKADAAMYHSKRNGRDRVSFVADDRFACVGAEAANGVSRNSLRWRCSVDESSAERSSH